MKPFTMEAVLKYRKRLKEQAMQSFQKAQRERVRAEAVFLLKKDEYLTLIARLKMLENQGITVDEYIRYRNRIEFVYAELVKCEGTLKKKTESVMVRRKQLVNRRKEEQALEKLKEKQNIEYLKFVEKKESAILDEIALLHRNSNDSPEPENFL